MNGTKYLTLANLRTTTYFIPMDESQLEQAEFDEVQIGLCNTITEAAKTVAKEAVERKTKIAFTFNGVWVPVYPGDGYQTIEKRYWDRHKHRKDQRKAKKMRATFEAWMENPLSNDRLADLIIAVIKFREYHG